MTQFTQLKTNLKNAEDIFKKGFENLKNDFQDQQKEETGRVSLDDGYLNKQPSDFGLHVCLHESMEQLERCIKEKPSRELALAKTKLQEALFWASQV